MEGLNFNLGAIWNDATYGPGYKVSCSQQQTAAQGCLPVFNAANVQIGTADDAEGNRLIGAPEWKVTGNVEYARHVGSGLEGYVQADLVYTSRISFNAAYDPPASNAPATIVGGRIGVRTEDGRYGVSIYGRNLFRRPSARFCAAMRPLRPSNWIPRPTSSLPVRSRAG